ncbi:MAG: hypothetical protein OM95_09245 [Bdellovibrio sp. ArHS]|nr:MAG: hypothetical protein OM95_09245 [Bdellovibrio sp. ArHS]
MVVGVALLGIMGMVAASFFVFTAKTKEEITNEIEDKVDNIIAERMILKDLKFSEPSFNNVLITDDTGFRFFDYVSDVSGDPEYESPRKLTLEFGRRNEFVFITTNDKLGTMMYTPAVAYELGALPASAMEEASLTFKSLNKGNEVSKSSPAIWQVGNLLMLDSPAAVREMTATGPNYKVPARSPIFVGSVIAPGESRLSPLNLPGFLNRTHPLYPNETIQDEDKFLRDIPPMGGAAPLVRLKAVNIIKYYLDKDPQTKTVNLLRSVYKNNTFSQGQLFAAGVSRVVFSRNNARDSLIYYQIIRPQDVGK